MVGHSPVLLCSTRLRRESTRKLKHLPRLSIPVLPAIPATLRLKVFATSVWTAPVCAIFKSCRVLLTFLSDYDLCSKCIGGGAAERHDPFHEFFDINEPGRVVVHVVGERDAANFNQAPRPAPAPAPPSGNTSPAIHNATCDLCDSRIRGDRYVRFNTTSAILVL